MNDGNESVESGTTETQKRKRNSRRSVFLIQEELATENDWKDRRDLGEYSKTSEAVNEIKAIAEEGVFRVVAITTEPVRIIRNDAPRFEVVEL